MLKKLTTIYTVIFTIAAAISLGFLLFGGSSYNINSLAGLQRYTSSTSYIIETLVNVFVSINIPGFITVVIASNMLHKDNDYFMAKIGIFIAFASLGLFIIYILLALMSSILPDVIMSIFAFIIVIVLLSYMYVIPLLLTLSIDPDNNITAMLKRVNVFVIIANFVSGLIFVLGTLLTSSMPDPSSTLGMVGFLAVIAKGFIGTLVIEVILIALGYIFNYSLSGGDIKETEELEMENDIRLAELKRQAEEHARMRQNSYNAAPVQEPVQPVPQPVVQAPTPVQEPVQVASQPVQVQPQPVQMPAPQNPLESLMQSKPQENVQPNNQ